MKNCVVTLMAVAVAQLLVFRGEVATAVDFNQDVLPLLTDRCFACHGPDEGDRQADLRLDQEASAKEAVIVPGDASASELWQRISSRDPDLQMPPPDSGKELTPDQQELIRRWIDEGAEWRGHWAFEPLRRPTPPEVPGTDVGNDVDRFVLDKLKSQGLSPSPRADRATLLRRISLDLTGLPPTLGELDRFLADDSAGAYEAAVDRLLNSPHYGERMAMGWLDGARFADTNGYQNDFGRSMWPWRDWVIDAFNRNMPFDQFVLEQLAGDLLPEPTRSQVVATGFNRNHRSVTEGGSIEAEWHTENVVDRVETTSVVLLGLTMGCARCHDHKYDPITQREFYRFFAFFNNVDEKGVYIETRGNVPPLVSVPSEAQRQQLDQLASEIATAEQTGDGERLESLRKELSELEKSLPTVMIMKERAERRPTYVLRRGQYDLPDTSEALEPGVPAFLPPLPPDAPPNRLGLARWMIAPSNPLVARVVANRSWQHFFGQGLVKNSDNLGRQSDPPSHPQLLDWLATELIRSGWDLKALQKVIVMSATYQRTSDATAPQYQADPANRWLARGPRFRMPAELIRDQALAISGLLSTRIGGPSVKPYQPAGLWSELAGGASQGPYVQDHGSDLYRRSLYTYRKRTVPHATMTTFDAPSFEICQVKRSRTNTPLQSLALLNDTTYVEAARMLARRMLSEVPDNPPERLAYGFRLATARPPDPSEIATLQAALDRYLAIYHADPTAAEQLLAHGESPVGDPFERADWAAYTTVASLLLNLDETVTKP